MRYYIYLTLRNVQDVIKKTCQAATGGGDHHQPSGRPTREHRSALVQHQLYVWNGPASEKYLGDILLENNKATISARLLQKPI